MADDSSSLQITIDVVDSSGSVQTINATTAAVQELGDAGTQAGADLGAIGAAGTQVTSDLGAAGASIGQFNSELGEAFARTQNQFAGLGEGFEQSLGGSAAAARSKAIADMHALGDSFTTLNPKVSGLSAGVDVFGKSLLDSGSAGQSSFSKLFNSIKQSIAPLPGATASGKELGAAFEAMGEAGSAGSTKTSSGLAGVTGHTGESLQAVRLLRDDFGIHLPRSMEMAIAKNSSLSGAITSMGGVLVGLGFAEIFARMAMGIYDAYEKYVSLNAAAEAYAETVKKQKDADFTNTHSIEETTARLNEATEAAKNYKTQAEAIHNEALFELNPVKGVGDLILANQLETDSVTKQQQAAALKQKQMGYDNDSAIALINQNHAMDGVLRGQQKINADKQKAHDLDAQKAIYAKTQDSSLQGGGVSHAGEQEQRAADAAADANAAVQTIELQRQISEKTISLQDAARNAGLQGNALFAAQEQEEIAGIERSATGSAAQVDAVRLKYHNMEIQRLQAETDEVNKRARAEQEASLTGLAKIQAQGQDTQNDITQKQDRGGYASSADADKDRETAHDATLREMADAEKTFGEQVQQYTDQASSKMITGYAKVDAQRDAAINKLSDDFAKVYEQLDQQDARYIEGQAQMATGVQSIYEQADRERVELHSKTMAEIQATEVQAAKMGESENKAATGAIIDDYNRRLAQAQATLHAELAGNKLSADDQAQVWQEYYARIKADADLAAAQMEKQAQESRDKLAGSLSSLFDDPAGFLEKRAKDMMYKVLANGIMSATNDLQSPFGKMLSNLLGNGEDLAAPTGSKGGIFGGSSGTAGAGSPLQTAGSTLNTAGTTLQTSGTNLGTAGTQLGNSGTVLNTAGTQLTSAANALQSAASALSSAQGGGGFSGGGGDDDGIGDSSGDDSGGSDDSGMSGASIGSTGASLSSAAAGFSGSGSTGMAAASGAQGAAGALSQAAGSTSALGKYAGAAGGAIAGGVGVYNAYENSSPLSGALSGGEAGAEIGGLFGPEGMVIGAAVGAVAGLVAGLFGDSGKAKAQAYDTGTVAPALATELANFNSGQTGYTQASRDLTNILNEAQSSTQSMGSGARKYFTNNITPEIAAVQTKLDSEEKAGRSRISMSAAQFHSGGLITGFGDFGTGGTEGFIHAMMGERVMNAQASGTHGPLLDAMNAGLSPATLSSQMRSAASSVASGSTTRLGSSGGGPSISIPISAIDAPSFQRALRNGLGKVIQQHLAAAPGYYGGKSDE